MARKKAPARSLRWWRQARYGMFIHWGLYSLLERGEWAKAKQAALEAEQLWCDTGYAQYAPDVLSILCRCHARQGDWKAFSSHETEALSVGERIGDGGSSVLCLLNVARAHVQVAAWYDDPQGDPPPLSRDEALSKATDYANRAKQLAEEKGMKGYVKKADELLADINRKS